MIYSQSLLNDNIPNLSNVEKVYKIEKFLKHNNFNIFKLEIIAGDCSNRIYYRIFTNKAKFILMDSSNDILSMQQFYQVANLLKNNDFSVPSIYDVDFESGLMLLEDFGSNSLNKHLNIHKGDEKKIYEFAAEVLVEFNNLNILVDIQDHSESIFDKGLNVFIDYYLIKKVANNDFEDAKNSLLIIFKNYFKQLNSLKPVLVHRDFMVDNLFYLPERKGSKKIGMIDFQDASIGSPAYDLLSLLEDSRRDVNAETQSHIYNHYLKLLNSIDKEKFYTSYSIIAAHRNLRVVGVFERMVNLYKKPNYSAYLPRTWRQVRQSLLRPGLNELSEWFKYYKVPFGDEL